MTPQEIQDIKDRATREKHKGFKLLQWQEDGYPPINLNDRLTDVIDLISGYNFLMGEVAQLEEELVAKREVKVPSNEDVEKKFPAFALTSDETKVPLYENQYKEEGANWAIEKIKDMNK